MSLEVGTAKIESERARFTNGRAPRLIGACRVFLFAAWVRFIVAAQIISP
jgi:hypothetical protein